MGSLNMVILAEAGVERKKIKERERRERET